MLFWHINGKKGRGDELPSQAIEITKEEYKNFTKKEINTIEIKTTVKVEYDGDVVKLRMYDENEKLMMSFPFNREMVAELRDFEHKFKYIKTAIVFGTAFESFNARLMQIK